MRIVTYLNTTKEEVESKKYNIWFGISLGNKYFSKENIEKYIPWLIDHTKDHLLIVIADTIQAINIEVFDELTKKRAEAIAERKGKQKQIEIEEIINKINTTHQKKINIVCWNAVEEPEEKRQCYKIIKDEFLNNLKFKDFIISIIKDFPKAAQKGCSIEEYEKLAEYILRELPLYINGAYYNGIRYLLQPYPGLTKLDDLIVGLQNKTMFPELAERLDIKNKMVILEAYAE